MTWLPYKYGISPDDLTQILCLEYLDKRSKHETCSLNLPPFVNFPIYVPAHNISYFGTFEAKDTILWSI
jgi:hypothetical protein